MNIIMWAGLCVLVAYNGNAELATLGVMLLTIVWAADEKRPGAGSSTSFGVLAPATIPPSCLDVRHAVATADVRGEPARGRL